MAGKLGTGENYNIGDLVGPIDAQNVSQTANIKGVEASIISGVEAPYITVIELHSDDACPIDCSFSLHSKLSVLQESCGLPGKHGGSLIRSIC